MKRDKCKREKSYFMNLLRKLKAEITKTETIISAVSMRCRVPQNLKIKVTLVLNIEYWNIVE